MRARTPPRKPPRRAGASLVEFALVAPLFFAFVFAMIDVGRGFMVESLMANAARAGCRVAVIPGRSTSDVGTAVDSALSGMGIAGYTTAVKVNGTAADASTAASGDQITVVVSAPVANVCWLPGAQYVKGTLSGQFSMPRE